MAPDIIECWKASG